MKRGYPPFDVQRKSPLRILARFLIAATVVLAGVLLFAGAVRGTAAHQLLLGSGVLVLLWWGLR